MSQYRPYPGMDDEEIQQVIDELLSDETFVASIDKLIRDAGQTQAWVEVTTQEQGNSPAGKLWHPWLRWLGIEVRTFR